MIKILVWLFGKEFCSTLSPLGPNSHNLHIWKGNVSGLVVVCSACLTSDFIGKFILPCIASLIVKHNTCKSRLHIKESVVRSLFHLVWFHFIPNYQFQLFGAKLLHGSHYPSCRNASSIIFKQINKGDAVSLLFGVVAETWGLSSALVTKISHVCNFVVWLCKLKILRSRFLYSWSLEDFNMKGALLLNLSGIRVERVSCKLMFKPKHTSL